MTTDCIHTRCQNLLSQIVATLNDSITFVSQCYNAKDGFGCCPLSAFEQACLLPSCLSRNYLLTVSVVAVSVSLLCVSLPADQPLQLPPPPSSAGRHTA